MILILYPTNAMREAVARLFASILKFCRVAVQFYRDGRLKHSVKAIFQPWSLAFQDVYDELATQAERVKELAALAAKAELRDAHIEILESRRVSNQMSSEIITLKSTVQDLKVMLEQRMVAHGDQLTSMSTTLFRSGRETADRFPISTVSRYSTRLVAAGREHRPGPPESAAITFVLAADTHIWGVHAILRVNATKTASMVANRTR